MPRKGADYEREVCRKLSLWFSGGLHDDWFWRSSQSGGRATARARKGQTTAGHCGDICATCDEGSPLTKFLTVEIKRGYSSYTPMDLIDHLPKSKSVPVFLGFIRQAEAAAERAGTPHWLLIHRRNGHDALVYMTRQLSRLLLPDVCWPFARFDYYAPHPDRRKHNVKQARTVEVVRLDFFLKHADRRMPARVLRIKK